MYSLKPGNFLILYGMYRNYLNLRRFATVEDVVFVPMLTKQRADSNPSRGITFA